MTTHKLRVLVRVDLDCATAQVEVSILTPDNAAPLAVLATYAA